jgi:hypothetical protein
MEVRQALLGIGTHSYYVDVEADAEQYQDLDTYHTQIFGDGNLRKQNFPKEADRTEISNIVAHDALQPVEDEAKAKEIIDSGNWLWLRMVRVFKSAPSTGEQTGKSRLCADGRDQKKRNEYERHETSVPTPSKLGLRVIFNYAVIFNVEICWYDIKCAFLKGLKLTTTKYGRLRADGFLEDSLPQSWRRTRIFRIVRCIYGMVE